MKIYVASAFGRWQEARAFMKAVRASAIDRGITYDWTQVAERVLVHNAHEDVAVQGRLDTNGVNEAEVLVLLCSEKPGMYGSLIEFGGAALAGKPCIVVGAEGWRITQIPFFHLPNVRCVPDTVAALAALDDLPPRRAMWLDVQHHYDHDAVAQYVPRAAVQTRWSLGGYDGPLVGLVQHEGRWLIAHCEDRDATERVFWLVDIGQERIAALLDYAERRFKAYGNCRYHADGTTDDDGRPYGDLGPHATPEFSVAARAWVAANPAPDHMPKPGDPVVGYFYNWRVRGGS